MELIKMIVLAGVLVACTVFDLLKYKIPNTVILIGMLAGIIMNFDKIGLSLIQMVVIFLVFFPFYRIKGLGAGDIKLMMMLAGFFTTKKLFLIIALAFMIGALFSVIKMLKSKEARSRLTYGFKYLRKIVITKTVDPYECNKTNKATVIPLALPLSIAAVLGGVLI